MSTFLRGLMENEPNDGERQWTELDVENMALKQQLTALTTQRDDLLASLERALDEGEQLRKRNAELWRMIGTVTGNA